MTEITPQQGELCVRTLASLAWADGSLADHEMEKIVDLVSQLEYIDASLVPEILFTPTRFVFLDQVRTLPKATRVRLLHDAFLVVCQEDTIGNAEIAILRELATTVVDPSRWEEVLACLQAYADYENRCRPLWGVTHLG